MTQEEHLETIREYTKLILRLLAGQNHTEIVALLALIDEHTLGIQSGK